MDYVFSQLELYFSDAVVWRWVAVAAIAIVFSLVLKALLHFFAIRFRQLTKRSLTEWDDAAVGIIELLKVGVVFFWAFYLLSETLEVPKSADNLLFFMVVLSSGYQVGVWGIHLIRVWNDLVLAKRIEDDPSSAAALGLLNTMVQAIFVILIILIALSNLGVNVTALITGLGVGGIAIALAAQNILGDLLASLSIALDKPFSVGDFIVAGTDSGTVEHIGIKTTRIRSITGQQVVLSNKDLLESRVNNYQRMAERRVVQKIGVAYSTPLESLKQIPQWVKEFIEKHDKLRFDRCHFSNYGDSSLDFEFVFYILSPDFNVFMDHQQTVLLDIYRKFSDEGIEFAFPSRSVYIEKLPELSERRDSRSDSDII